MNTKVCTKCGRELPLSEFHIARREKDGHVSRCKRCSATESRKNATSKVCRIPWDKNVIMYFKKCSQCKKVYHISSFTKTSKNRNGLSNTCKSCNKTAATKYYKTCTLKNSYPIYYRFCTQCGELKHISNYYKDKNHSSGYRYKCKKCEYKNHQNRINNISCKINNKIKPIFKACKKCKKVYHISEYSVYANYPNLCCKCAKLENTINNQNRFCRISPRSKIYFKFCSSCGQIKHIENYFNSSQQKTGKDSSCKACANNRNRSRLKVTFCKTDIKSNVYFKACTKCNRVLHIAKYDHSKTYQTGAQSWCKECRSELAKHKVKNLTEDYVKDRLGWRNRDIPQGLVELKRSQLKLHRAIKSVRS